MIAGRKGYRSGRVQITPADILETRAFLPEFGKTASPHCPAPDPAPAIKTHLELCRKAKNITLINYDPVQPRSKDGISASLRLPERISVSLHLYSEASIICRVKQKIKKDPEHPLMSVPDQKNRLLFDYRDPCLHIDPVYSVLMSPCKKSPDRIAVELIPFCYDRVHYLLLERT